MSQLKQATYKYDDGRTKQSFRDETDINQIMARAARTGTVSHLSRFQPVYADYSEFDFFECTQKLTRGREIFDKLPPEIRKEFSQNPQEFFNYVNNPANVDRLDELLPALAAPGRQLPDVSGRTAPEPARASTPAADNNPVATPEPPAPEPATPPTDSANAPSER